MKELIKIDNLKQHFKIGTNILSGKQSVIKAVDGVSLTIYDGETLGLVGESGSGKTTLGRTLLHLYKPTSGKVFYKDDEINHVKGAQFKAYRRKMQYIFQDPYASLDPRMTVADIVGEPLDIHKLTGNKKDKEAKIMEILRMVGLSNEHASRYPHEFSGGQRQRIGIARALAVQPEFIVCDEPVSALDVSIRAQILNMLEEMQKSLKLTYLFISHDLAVVRHISTRVGVMYLGKLVELADVNEIFDKPLHPYTRALISAIPEPDPDVTRNKQRVLLKGEIPSSINPPSGCKFRTRCQYVQDICKNDEPDLKEISPGHYCACHFAGKL